MKIALTNGRIVLPDRISAGQAVVIEGDAIVGWPQPMIWAAKSSDSMSAAG